MFIIFVYKYDNNIITTCKGLNKTQHNNILLNTAQGYS